MKQFLKGYNKEIYGRELVGKVKISQKNIALTLNELENEGILSSKIKGNLRHYSLNWNNSLIKKYLAIGEMEKSIEFLKKNLKISQIFEKISKKEVIICIFGSYAKDIQKKDSDIDIFLAGNINEKEIKEIAESYNLNISIKKGSKKYFRELIMTNNPLINEIIENHVVISGYEEFIDEIIKKWQA